jgi:DNA-binding NarL/FixJ family response regulator
VFRIGLQTLLASYGHEVVLEAGSLSSLERHVDAADVDVFVIDVNLGHAGAGLLAARLVRRKRPEARVVLVSAVLDPDLVDPACVSGAHAYLGKDLRPAVLIEAIEAVAAGRGGDHPANFLAGRGPGATPAGRAAGARSRLSPRETEVLDHVRMGRTNKEIAMALGISRATINKHVHQVLTKLGARNRAEAVSKANNH